MNLTTDSTKRHAGFDPTCPGCQKEAAPTAAPVAQRATDAAVAAIQAELVVSQARAAGRIKPGMESALRSVALKSPALAEDFLVGLNAPTPPRSALSGHPSDFVGQAPEAYDQSRMPVHNAAIETMKRHEQAGQRLSYAQAVILVTKKGGSR